MVDKVINADRYLQYENELIEKLKNTTDKIKNTCIEDKYLGQNLPIARNKSYVRKFITQGTKTFLFIGMDPNIDSCGQTSVPFGEIGIVKNWMGVDPKKMENFPPGFKIKDETDSEGYTKFYKYFMEEKVRAEDFFRDSFVINFSPALFIDTKEKRKYRSLYNLSVSENIKFLSIQLTV